MTPASAAPLPARPSSRSTAKANSQRSRCNRDGKILAAGRALSVGGSKVDDNFGLLRVLDDGTADTSFEGDGVVLTDFNAESDDSAAALALGDDDRVVLGGNTSNGNLPLAVRYKVDLDDTGPPATTIDSGPPAGSSNDNDPTFTFSSEPRSTFECTLRRPEFPPAFSPCSSPKTFSNRLDGFYLFEVKATNEFGVVGGTESRSFTIDTVAPSASIDTGPADGSTITTDSVTFVFSSGDGTASFECRLSGGAYVACTSPKSYANLADGTYTFEVRAKDGAGNTSPAQSRTFTVDTTGATTSIDSGPAAGSTITTDSATFGFSANETGSTFECSLDGAAFAACTSPQAYGGLADGSHTFAVRATDSVGNTGPVTTRTFTVDTSGGGAGGGGGGGVGTGGGGGTGNGADTEVTDLDTTAKKTQKQKGKSIKIKVSVGAAEAITVLGKGTIEVKGQKKGYELKDVSKQIDAGERTILRLKLKKKKDVKKVKQAIKRYKKAPRKQKQKLAVKAPVQVVATDAAGNEENEKRVVRLK